MAIRGDKQSAVLTDSTLVSVGGFFGTIFRYFAQKAADSYDGTWPIVTFVINIVGSLALGLLISTPKRVRLLLGTGVCGAFTTYGLFAFELYDRDLTVSITYAVASLVVGTLAFALGARVTHR